MELNQDNIPMTVEEIAAAVAMNAEAIPLNETSPEVELFVSVEDSQSQELATAMASERIHEQARAELGADEAYFREPVAPPAYPVPPVPSPMPVHPAAEEIKQQLQGLTAEEIMAGMLPELSKLYRRNAELVEAVEELRGCERVHLDCIADRDDTIARTYEEVSTAYIAGQEVEQELGTTKADIILLRTALTVAITQRDSHLNDLHVICDMLREILVRSANIQDAASHNEYHNDLCRKTAVELVRELVGQATDPRDTTQSFVSRVATCRSRSVNKATDGGSSNEQNSSAEGLLQG